MIWTVVMAAMVALAVAGSIGARAMPLGRAIGLLDWPDPEGGRKRHARVTPLMGGSAVIVSVLAATAIAGWGDVAGTVERHLAWFALTVGALYLIGMLDDRFELGPRLRLVFGAVMFALACIYAPDFRIEFLHFDGVDRLFLLGTAGVAFSVLCLVGLLNAVNMADGKDGLVISLSLFWTAMLWGMAPAGFDPVFAALIVALAVTLRYNMAGRLFLGDGGSYGISAIVGLLAIHAYNNGFADVRAERIALLFAVPVFDTVRLITMRAARGRSPFSADRDHLHHHIAFRWGWPRGLPTYLALVIVPNLVAAAWPAAAAALLILNAVAYAAVLILSTRHTGFSREFMPDPDRPGPLREEPGGATSG